MRNDSKNGGFEDNDFIKVYVFFHSHNDAGYIKTYREYYDESTRNILNLLVKKMDEFRSEMHVLQISQSCI